VYDASTTSVGAVLARLTPTLQVSGFTSRTVPTTTPVTGCRRLGGAVSTVALRTRLSRLPSARWVTAKSVR
jgi:hypothetical protein